ncbi:MAG: HAD-IIIA family hydrolase [bacterium]|nr:HAD-IIIA family hydrolase [bacterium]
MIKQAVILAGGKGERLRPFTDTNSKPMIDINGRPFLEYLLEMLKEQGISEIVLLLGYLSEKITEHFGDGSKFGLNIKYSVLPLFDEKDLENESGTRIKEAAPLLDDIFLLMYCDNYWPLDLEKLSDFYFKQGKLSSVVAYTNKDNFTKNNILIDNDGIVVKYDRSRQELNLNGVEIGFFIIDKKVFEMFPNYKFHFEKEILPKLIEKKELAGFLTDHRYYSISAPERLESTKKFLIPKKVIFLDRDGVINKRPPRADYVKKWEEFEFLSSAIEGLKLLSQQNYDVYLISNQPGIARGMMKKEDLEDVQKKMEQELEKNNVKISGAYFCLHGWDEGCECRKPKPGLLFRAARENDLDLSKAVFIGDDERDFQAGEAAGCRAILLKEGEDLLGAVKSLIKTA